MSIVYLVGAGPGDPGLLTLRAKELIERADVLIYDYLANKEFLSFASPECEVIYVGKKGGDHTLPQDQINTLLVDKALEEEGRIIVRLKGGDPYVFGRGAEEAEELVEAGVAFEVVPGVTSAVAAPAYAGIPITHRRFTSSVSFITGHEDPTKDATSINWGALAASGSTLVFFMGVKNLPVIAQKLMENGMRADMPCALVHWGTTCRQRSFVSTLDRVAEEAKAFGYKAPSLIIVGEVCSLKEGLDWYEMKPLLGCGVVVTRSREQASDLSSRLRELGACCYEFPTIEIAPLPDDAPVRAAAEKLADNDWVVFTSVNGVWRFFDVLDDMGLDARAFGAAKVAAIGPATAAALCERGIRADFVPEKYVAEDVVDGLLARGVKGAKVLIPRARQAREVLPEKLTEAGAEVVVLPVYETRLADADPAEILEALEKGGIQVVTFTSSSTVENFFAKIAPEAFAPYKDQVKLACIGPVTAKTLERYGFTPDVMAGEYTIPGLIDAVMTSIT